MSIVRREGRSIALYAAENYGEDPELLNPGEAREIARKLVEIANAIDADLAAVRAACEREGHLRDGYNALKGLTGPKIRIEFCTRDGCDAQRQLDGAGCEHVEMLRGASE